jgi:hypothetical protein
MQGRTELPPPPPLQPRSVGEILETAFRLYGRHWAVLMQIVAVVVVPLTLLQYLVGDAVSGNVTTTTNGQVALQEGAGQGILAGFLVAVLGLLILQILYGAVAWAVATVLVGRQPDIGESYRFGYRRMWSILLVGVLFALAVFGGLILFVVPGVIFAVRFSVSVPALVVEGRRGTEALSRSWNLVRGYSWPVFGAFLVAFLLTSIVNSVLTSTSANWFVQGVLASIGSIVTTPFVGLVIGLIYFDLRVRKEMLDVAMLDRELQAASS